MCFVLQRDISDTDDAIVEYVKELSASEVDMTRRGSVADKSLDPDPT